MQWAEVINNPFLKDLPFKIELNKWGQILMSPASNRHGILQSEVIYLLRSRLPKGTVIAECSIQTADGVKVAEVAWASETFMERNGETTPYGEAPEICIEIVSPSNSKEEMAQKVSLYLEKGAQEVWICAEDGNVEHHKRDGIADTSDSLGEQVELSRHAR
jgi:Uma2 family endonuclease